MTTRTSLRDAVRLGLATVSLLGTASLLFVLMFREPPFETGERAVPIADHLLDLTVVDERTVWAVGHDGRILGTRDGGRNWKFARSAVDSPLAAVAFRDGATGLAVGYAGVILRTTDAGDSWSRVPSGVEVYLTSVRFLADGRAFAAGEWGTILTSEDGGATWRTVTSGEHDFIVNDLDLDPSGIGWAVGELGLGMETADGGRSWTERRITHDQTPLFTVDVLGPTEIWAAGGDSRLLHSTDGGSSWEHAVAPCRPTQLLRLRFAADRGYVVGRRCVAMTEDGGATWRPSALGDAVRFSWLYGLHVTPGAVWAAGYGESIFRTGVDDRSWTRVVVARDETPADG
ncbi:MAG: WD40/YVTN/BNR-like repeat-containing protein [Candidatus Binatia bacterium]